MKPERAFQQEKLILEQGFNVRNVDPKQEQLRFGHAQIVAFVKHNPLPELPFFGITLQTWLLVVCREYLERLKPRDERNNDRMREYLLRRCLASLIP